MFNYSFLKKERIEGKFRLRGGGVREEGRKEGRKEVAVPGQFLNANNAGVERELANEKGEAVCK